MDWILMTTVLVGISVDGIVQGCIINPFIRIDSLSNTIPPETTPVHIHSAMGCARACRSTTGCAGFYHSDSHQRCVFDVDVVFTNFTSDPSASYYVKTGTKISSTAPTSSTISTTSTPPTTSSITTISTTSTTTSTTTPTSTSIPTTTLTSTTTTPSTTASGSAIAVSYTNCSTIFTEDILLIGAYGNYRLKIVHQGVSRTQAEAICQSYAMNLFRPNEQYKVNAVLDFLTSCTGYNAEGYWTEAEKQVGEDGQPWKNSDGSAVLLEVWCNNTPGYHSNEYCARLGINCNYKLMDIGCGYTSYATWGFICE